MCIEDGCKVRPIFNIEGVKKALYCLAHKKDGMIDVKSKTCIENGCKKQPNFNKEFEKKALYCVLHKKDGMVDVKSKTCIEDGCKKQPNYNIEFEKKALYCLVHKKDGMVDVKNKTCIENSCKIRPTFNIEFEKKALYCVLHKKNGMVDVKHKTCIENGCKKCPNYNIEFEKKALYCVTHKKNGMIDVKNKTCIENGCKKRPTFNIEDEKTALYCLAHKKDKMVNVISKTCKTYLCSTHVQEKYDGYCLFCYINLFPDKPVSRNYKTKEYSVVEYVKTQFPNLKWVADKIVNGGCSKRRPDLLLDLLYQIIIIEIDENQHIDYDCTCQNKRIMELSQDLGHRPIVFIRFNPDDYKKNGANVSSCWGHDKNGICAVKKTKKSEWTKRLNTLNEQINYWVNPTNMTNKTIETIQLFYDV